MALAIPGFPAQEVRDGLRLPMRMGLPADEAKWPTFVTPATPAAPAGGMDADGVPWSPDDVAVAPEPAEVSVVCALQWEVDGQVVENFGARQPSTVLITLLDEEYAQIEGFEYVLIYASNVTPTRFFYRKVRARFALDAVEVFQIECSTEDVA